MSACYHFQSVTACEMCGSSENEWRIKGRRLDRSQGWRPWRVSGAATTVVRCRVCGLVFANPMPLPATLSDHYEVDAVSYFGAERAGIDEDVFQDEIRRACDLLSGIPRPSALDVGAGTGRVMAALQRAGFETWGIEPSSSFRDHGLGIYDLDSEKFLLTSLEEAALPAATFDFITFGAVLEHLPAPGRAIEKALTWLRPGGIIHAEVPSSKWLIGRLLNLYFRATGSGLVTNLSPMHAPYHLFEFTTASFRRHGERTGYSVVETRVFPASTFVGGVAGRLLNSVMAATGTGMQLIVWLRATSDKL